MVQKRKSTMVRKQQIIGAARKLIVKKGSEHLTVRSIAKLVNITEAAIYRHFRSKREILSFLMKHITESMLETLNTKPFEGTAPLEAVNQILTHHLSEIEERQGMSFQVIAEIISLGDKKLNKEVYDSITSYLDRLRTLLLEGVRAGIVREDIDLEASAMLIFGMIQGLVNVWALSNYSFDLAKKYSSLWAILREAIFKGQPSGWDFGLPEKNVT
jgi:TetR/AcrR family fatty acid metabolism transcriptional regulator